MNIDECIDRMKNVQTTLLEYIRDESNVEENFENLVNVIEDQLILKNPLELKELLRLISIIGSNHRRVMNFFDKLERILQYIKNEITKYLSNSEIFELFRNSKRFLLFLVEEKIMTIDEYIVSRITSNEFYQKKYPEYFAPEIKPFFTDEFINNYKHKNKCLKKDDFIKEIKKEQPKNDDFYSKRKEGENDNNLCKLIRLNQIKEFIVHVNKTNLALESYIQESIFETNPLLMSNKKIKIIEYALFYGSNEIIRYMHKNGAELPSSMWLYAVHSEDAELIKFLEDNQVSPPGNDFETVLKESIKSHHNDVSTYIINYLIDEEELKNNIEKNFYENHYRYSFEYYNYCFFPKNMKNNFIFYYLCEFGYYELVKLLLENVKIDLNATIIKNINIF